MQLPIFWHSWLSFLTFLMQVYNVANTSGYQCRSSFLNIHKVMSTRWTSRDEALTTFRFMYKQVLKTLTEIKVSLKSKITNERAEWAEANRLKNKLQIFSFFWWSIFKNYSFVSPVSRYLQSKWIYMKNTKIHLKSAYKSIKQIRVNFVDMKTAVELARAWEIESNFSKKG